MYRFKNIYGDYIVVHTKCGWSPYKDWPVDRWQQLVDRLIAKYPRYKFFHIGEGKSDTLNGCARLQTSIRDAIQLIKESVLLIGQDSFSNHASALFPYTPSVILWGSTAPTGSGYPHNTNIWLGKSCSPCYREYDFMSADPKGKCPFDPKQSWEKPEHPCMWEISVDTVFDAVVAKLEERNE